MNNLKKIICILSLSLLAPIAIMAQGLDLREVYKVKKNETIFSIAQRFGVTIDEILDANPTMREPGYELKKGKKINIPFHKEPVVDLEAIRKAEEEARMKARTVNVGVMLPLHDNDGDGKRMTEYYRGVLMAINKLKADTINVNVRAWNVTQTTNLDSLIHLPGMTDLNLIIGPLYSSQVKTISDFCHAYNVRMLIPFSIQTDEITKNNMIYQAYQSHDNINEAALMHYKQLFGDCNTVIIDCNEANSSKLPFTNSLDSLLTLNNMSITKANVNDAPEEFVKAFSLTKRNVVVLTSARSPILTKVFSKLNTLTADNIDVKVSMFGYMEWLMYQKYNNNEEKLSKYDAYIPSFFYYNSDNTDTKLFEKQYKAAFKTPMQTALPHFALTGYDQALFFIGGIVKWHDEFKGMRTQHYATPLQTPYNFVQQSANSGYRNKHFQLVHFRNDGNIESLAY